MCSVKTERTLGHRTNWFLHAMVSGIPLVLGLRARMQAPHVYVVFGAPNIDVGSCMAQCFDPFLQRTGLSQSRTSPRRYLVASKKLLVLTLGRKSTFLLGRVK